MKHFILAVACATPFFANAMVQIKQQHLLVPEELSAVSLLKSEEGFSILEGNIEKKVNSFDVDPVLRSLSTVQLAKALKTNRIKVSQLSNEDYKLALQSGLKGGGILCAGFAYTITKVVGWSAAAVGVAGAATSPDPISKAALIVNTAIALESIGAGIEGAAVTAAVIFSVPWLP